MTTPKLESSVSSSNFEADLAAQMVEGIDRFLTEQTSAALARGEERWKRDFSSREACENSLAPNRHRLRNLIGIVESKRLVDGLVLDATTERPSRVASTETQ